jgi:hypothetical protein
MYLVLKKNCIYTTVEVIAFPPYIPRRISRSNLGTLAIQGVFEVEVFLVTGGTMHYS